MKTSAILAIVSSFVAIGGACWYYAESPRDMSGTYVGSNDHQAFLVQVIQGSGGALFGVYEEKGVASDGTTQEDSIPLAGARHGHTLLITLTPSGIAHFIAGNISLSGSISGSTLTLQGGNTSFNLNLVLQRQDISAYENLSSELEKRSHSILVAKAEVAERQQEARAQAAALQAATDAAVQLEQTANLEVQAINRVPQTLVSRLAQLVGYTEKFQKDTANMQSAINIEDSNGGYLGPYGGRVSSGIQNLYFENTSVVNDLRSHLQEVQQSGVIALLGKVQETNQACNNARDNKDNQPALGGSLQGYPNCVALSKVTPQLESEVAQLQSAYEKVFNVWSREEPRQQYFENQAFR